MKKMIILGVVAMFSTLGFVTEANAGECYEMTVTIDCGDGKTTSATVGGHNTGEMIAEAIAIANDFCG